MEKKLSCKRCQYRKLKCSRTEPCGSCTEAGKVCEYREVDRKRRPVSAKYVMELENRVAHLEALLAETGAVSGARAALLNAPDLDNNAQGSSTQGSQHQLSPTNSINCSDNLEPGPEGSLVYHGPTSIVHTRLRQSFNTTANTDPDGRSFGQPSIDSSFEQIAEHFGITIEDELVTNALMLFFKWQYPQFMFIYREAFLRDHFSDRQNCKYWSSGLLLSVCALGLLMSTNSLHRRSSEQFFSAAETMLIVFGFTRPSIATVQAFLCLAFYEIGRGNLSKGWGFSGVAFRMAQDLGFQRDPKFWISCDTSLATTEDIEIRRRIFWGCYSSDKLISLTLGRPVYFSNDDAEVENLERLPDFPELEYWLPIGFDSQQGDFGETKPLVPCFQKQIELSRIIEQMLVTISSSSRKAQDPRAYQASLESLNMEMTRWQTSLPDCAKWNKWEPSSALLIPSVAGLHLLFHGTRIAMNFDAAVLDITEPALQNFRDHCVSSAQDITSLVRRYRSQYGLRYAPFALVYSLAQASRCMSFFGTDDEVKYLAKAMSECSSTWEIGHQLGS
ncbi:fungal-specific transcription factor domain-containing protein [Mariannaea sp. PMI_226]|nr:fungal-specific transcription factor domain-containing protein [Mariannaea sp. PMI_226]